MNKKSESRTILHLLFFFACAMWLVAVLICKSGQEYSIHDSERIADQEMYECKHNMKAERMV